MSLVRTTLNAKKIVRGKVYCDPCGDRYYSAYDKLFIHAYGMCALCLVDIEDPSEEEFKKMQEEILAIAVSVT